MRRSAPGQGQNLPSFQPPRLAKAASRPAGRTRVRSAVVTSVVLDGSDTVEKMGRRPTHVRGACLSGRARGTRARDVDSAEAVEL